MNVNRCCATRPFGGINEVGCIVYVFDDESYIPHQAKNEFDSGDT